MARLQDGAVAGELPLLFEAVPDRHRALIAHLCNGGSLRGWEDISQYIEGLEPRGKSQLGRDYAEVSSELLRSMSTRSLADLNLAAIMADGTPIGGRTLVWAVGITMDGTKVPLGLAEGPAETAEVVSDLLGNLTERGLDTSDVLWLVDGGQSLNSAIEDSTRGRATIQRCRVHKARNVVEHNLAVGDRESIGKEARDRLWKAWGKADLREATADVEGVATWLESLGHGAAAESVREGMELTLTLQRLGMDDPAITRSLSTTNVIESPNAAISKWEDRVKTWGPAEAPTRRRCLVTAVAGAERNWTKLATRSKLERLSLAVATARHFPGLEWTAASRDARAVTVTRLPVAAGAERDAYVALWDLFRWADRNGKAVEIGDEVLAEVATTDDLKPWLERCGVDGNVRHARPPGSTDWAKVTSVDFTVTKLVARAKDEEAARALAEGSLGGGVEPVCRGSPEMLGALGLKPEQRMTLDEVASAVQGRHVATGKQVRRAVTMRLAEGEGALAGQTVTGWMTLGWEHVPPAEVTEHWRNADPERQAAIEEALLASAEAALGRIVTTEGMAAAVAIEKDPAPGGGVRVRGVVFGVDTDGQLKSAITKSVFREQASLEHALSVAAAAGGQSLEAELARLGPAQGVERGRAVPATGDYLAALGDGRSAWIEAQTTRADAVLADWSLPALQAERAKATSPFEQLERVTEDPDGWMRRHRWDAVQALALDAELARRQGAIARDGGVTHLLEGYREALGGRRVRELDERAQTRAHAWSARPVEWLRQQRGDLAASTRPIDREAASATRAIERDRESLLRQGDGAEVDAAALAQLAQREQALRDSGAHLDDWMRENAAGAADRVAVQALINGHQRERAAAAPEAEQPQRAVEEAGIEV